MKIVTILGALLIGNSLIAMEAPINHKELIEVLFEDNENGIFDKAVLEISPTLRSRSSRLSPGSPLGIDGKKRYGINKEDFEEFIYPLMQALYEKRSTEYFQPNLDRLARSDGYGYSRAWSIYHAINHLQLQNRTTLLQPPDPLYNKRPLEMASKKIFEPRKLSTKKNSSTDEEEKFLAWLQDQKDDDLLTGLLSDVQDNMKNVGNQNGKAIDQGDSPVDFNGYDLVNKNNVVDQNILEQEIRIPVADEEGRQVGMLNIPKYLLPYFEQLYNQIGINETWETAPLIDTLVSASIIPLLNTLFPLMSGSDQSIIKNIQDKLENESNDTLVALLIAVDFLGGELITEASLIILAKKITLLKEIGNTKEIERLIDNLPIHLCRSLPAYFA